MIVQTFRGNRCESDNSIFAWRVTWNYAYSPFNQTYQLPNRASEVSPKLLFITNLKWWFTSFEYSKLIPSFLNENVNILFYFYFLIHSFKQCKEISNLNRLNTHVLKTKSVENRCRATVQLPATISTQFYTSKSMLWHLLMFDDIFRFE